MKRNIIETKGFEKKKIELLAKRKLLLEDYKDFTKDLVEHPKLGDIVTGTGGIRKVRLKSANSGKSGGFRVCYYYYQPDEGIYLILIYEKSKQESLTSDEKKELKALTNGIKRKKI